MEGYLYQRGKSKIWYLRYDSAPVDGKRNQKNVRIGKMTKSEAEAKKRDMLRKLDDGTLFDAPAVLTVQSFLETWLDSQKHYLATNTHERYTSLLKRHVIPSLGSVKLAKVQPEHVRRIYQTMNDQGLTARTQLHVHRVLHTAFNHAGLVLTVS